MTLNLLLNCSDLPILRPKDGDSAHVTDSDRGWRKRCSARLTKCGEQVNGAPVTVAAGGPAPT